MPPRAMAKFSVTITPKGRRKLAQIKQALELAAAQALEQAALKFRTEAAALAPSPEEEAQMLSEGTVQKGVSSRRRGLSDYAGSFVGDPDNGRFLRRGGQLSLRVAIARSEPVIRQEGTRIIMDVGRYGDLNALTGFSWKTVSRGTLSTRPFNGRYVEAVESGGAWDVTPRPSQPPHALQPADDVYAAEMYKTIRPFLMFRQARARAANELRRDFRALGREALKAIP